MIVVSFVGMIEPRLQGPILQLCFLNSNIQRDQFVSLVITQTRSKLRPSNKRKSFTLNPNIYAKLNPYKSTLNRPNNTEKNVRFLFTL